MIICILIIDNSISKKLSESKYIFSSTTDCDETMGCGRSIAECIEQINERLDF